MTTETCAFCTIPRYLIKDYRYLLIVEVNIKQLKYFSKTYNDAKLNLKYHTQNKKETYGPTVLNCITQNSMKTCSGFNHVILTSPSGVTLALTFLGGGGVGACSAETRAVKKKGQLILLIHAIYGECICDIRVCPHRKLFMFCPNESVFQCIPLENSKSYLSARCLWFVIRNKLKDRFVEKQGKVSNVARPKS